MGSYQQATGSTIQEAFERFHENNPSVYVHFKKLAFKAINAGKRKISSKMICNVIRWEVWISTVDEGYVMGGDSKTFKINDAYTSRYARLFIKDYPEHEDKIELREIRSI